MKTKCKSFDELREKNSIRGKEWGESDITTKDGFLLELLFRSNELGGECGEAQNEVKKLARQYLDMSGSKSTADVKKALSDEIADTIICCDRLAEMLNIDLAEAVAEKFNKTSDKHGFKTKFNQE